MIWLGLALIVIGVTILTAFSLIWPGPDSRLYSWIEKMGLTLLLIGIVVSVLAT